MGVPRAEPITGDRRHPRPSQGLERRRSERVRLIEVGRPEGTIFTTAEVKVEIEARDGKTVCISPEFPVPLLYAWGYRVARKLGLPVASTLEPRDLSFEFGVPGWLWPGDDSPRKTG